MKIAPVPKSHSAIRGRFVADDRLRSGLVDVSSCGAQSSRPGSARGRNERGQFGVPPVLATAPILVSAFLLVTLALILPLGLILVRHQSPTEPKRSHLAALPIRITPRP